MQKFHFRPYSPNQTVLFPERIDMDIYMGVRPELCLADRRGHTWFGVYAGFRLRPYLVAIIGGYAFKMRSE